MFGFGFLICVLLGLCRLSMAEVEKERRNCIVHMAKYQMPESFKLHSHWYGTGSSLKSVSESAEMLYTYNNVLHGFSTSLTEEAKSMEGQAGVLSVWPELKYELYTTRTPEFLGLGTSDAMFPESESLSDVIIGVLDTGVWPESKSYDDTGLGPVPCGWKGECEFGTNFSSSNCNKKLIGARFFSKGYEATMGPIDESKESKSPRDDDGTHTISRAAGSAVEGASLFGYALGTARGMASQARVAVYKVCWVGGCFSSDILKAIDQATADNVNVISMSLGGGTSEYFRDSVAVGAFTAMEKGIFISCSAGNRSSFSLSNLAPWITTAGAGALDRDFPAFVSLGNGQNYSCVSLFRGNGTLLTFVYAGNASNSTKGNLCMMGTLIPEKVEGKIVLCDISIAVLPENLTYCNAFLNGLEIFEIPKKSGALPIQGQSVKMNQSTAEGSYFGFVMVMGVFAMVPDLKRRKGMLATEENNSQPQESQAERNEIKPVAPRKSVLRRLLNKCFNGVSQCFS